MQKRKYLLFLLLFSLFVPMALAQHVARAKQIRLFYDRYMESIETRNREKEHMEDYEDIDPLVDCADFDAFWYPSIKVDSIDCHIFRFSYDTDVDRGWRKDIKVTVTRENGKFLISDIETE